MQVPRRATLATVLLALIGVVGLAGCAEGDSSDVADAAVVSAVPPRSTTPEGGAAVAATFPTVQGLPLTEPEVLRSRNGTLALTLNLDNGEYQVAGHTVKGMTMNGQFMGPTLVIDPGDTLTFSVVNNLGEPTNIHEHGLHVSPIGISDNVLRTMEPGSTSPVVVNIPTTQAPGTYWYHAHLHGLTEAQVMAGLFGTLIIDGLTDLLPTELQAGLSEHLVALHDYQLTADGEIVTENIDSAAPTTRTVNGMVNPVLTSRPGQTQLLRLANFSADIWYRLHLDGAAFSVIAEDANPVGRVEKKDELLLPPGKRFDVLVALPKAGSYKLRTLPYDQGPAGDKYPERVLMTINVAGDPVATPPQPTTMAPLPGYEHDVIAKRRLVWLSEDNEAGKFFVNGKQFDGTVLFTPQLGTTEEWTIRNVTAEDHPFHIHVNDFQVMSVKGKRYDAVSLQDIVKVPAHGQVVIRMRFETFTGSFVFHCHILAHEDGGMMAIVDVTADGKPDPSSPVSTMATMGHRS